MGCNGLLSWVGVYPLQGGAAVYRALQGFTGALCAVGRGAAVQRREEGRKKGRREEEETETAAAAEKGEGVGKVGREGRKKGKGVQRCGLWKG